MTKISKIFKTLLLFLKNYDRMRIMNKNKEELRCQNQSIKEYF